MVIADGPRIPGPAFQELEAIYERVRSLVEEAKLSCRRDGACCRFESSGLRLFATTLERAFLVRSAGPPPAGAPPGRCPYLEAGLCKARAGRTLGCRIHFCDPLHGEGLEPAYEALHREIKSLHGKYGIPYDYRDITDPTPPGTGRCEDSDPIRVKGVD